MGFEFFLDGPGVGFTIYIVVQLLAVLTLRRPRRIMALIPAPIMLSVLLWTIYAYRRDSNLYPIVMIFASPPAALAVFVTWVLSLMAQKREASSNKQVHTT